MFRRERRTRIAVWCTAIGLLLVAGLASGQEDTEPGVLRFGTVVLSPDLKVYADYQIDVGSDDLDNAFHITRAYLGLRAQLTDWLGGRVTFDVTQADDLGRAGPAVVGDGGASVAESHLNGSVIARLKYAYLDLAARSLGLHVRFGMIQTPYLDWVEHIEGARFLRKVMLEQEFGYPSADFGVALLGEVGDVLAYHVGVYDGEGYHGLELSGAKDFVARVSVRPAPGVEALSGLQVSGYTQLGFAAPQAEAAHRRYGGALTYRLADEISSTDCTRVAGDRFAGWFQAFTGEEGPPDSTVRSFGLSFGGRLELPAHLFFIGRLDRFDPDVDTGGDLVWTPLAAFGIRPYGGVAIALDYQGRLRDGGDDQHFLGVHTELRL